MAGASSDAPAVLPEFFFATVRATGTPVDPVRGALEDALAPLDVHLHPVKISSCLSEFPTVGSLLDDSNPDKAAALLARMNAGDGLRIVSGRGDAVALGALRSMPEHRERARTDAMSRGKSAIAYLFRNLMHPKEVETLRKLYGSRFFTIAVFYPRAEREEHLKNQFAAEQREGERSEAAVRRILNRDEGDLDPSYREEERFLEFPKLLIDIADTFAAADLFLDWRQGEESVRKAVERFIELIFGHPFHTPSRDEIGMSYAFEANRHSANLARRVGAAICNDQADVLSIGTNDVPRAGGGVYRSDQVVDNRDFNLQEHRGDASDRLRRAGFIDLLKRLVADPGWLEPVFRSLAEGDDLYERVRGSFHQTVVAARGEGEVDRASTVNYDEVADVAIQSPVIWSSIYFDVIEYGRTLHAEMHAIASAARSTVSIEGATLFCTTMPCHECARLILGSGISRVVYVEPYDKSRIHDLYRTEISRVTASTTARANTIAFEPYIGISPERFAELFSWVPRKADDADSSPGRTLRGAIVNWKDRKGLATLRGAFVPQRGWTEEVARLQEEEAALIGLLEEGLNRLEEEDDKFVEDGGEEPGST